MLTNFGVKQIPFFHIRPHILHNFLTICILTKGMGLSSLALGEDPFKGMGTSSMWSALEGSKLQLENKGGEDGRVGPWDENVLSR
jgi:hypothetical protein